MRPRLLALAVLLAAAWSFRPDPGLAQVNAGAQSRSCTVAFVTDGDTFNCRDGSKVRLLLVDAPEDGPYGDLARDALAGLLSVGRTFRLEVDSRETDKQGRVLAYVFLADGRMVNEMMVREGYAFLKPDEINRKYLPDLRTAEAAARETGRGLWAR